MIEPAEIGRVAWRREKPERSRPSRRISACMGFVRGSIDDRLRRIEGRRSVSQEVGKAAGFVAFQKSVDSIAQFGIPGARLIEIVRALIGILLLKRGKKDGLGGSGIDRHGGTSTRANEHPCDKGVPIVSPKMEKRSRKLDTFAYQRE
jgi:hypothetical protein